MTAGHGSPSFDDTELLGAIVHRPIASEMRWEGRKAELFGNTYEWEWRSTGWSLVHIYDARWLDIAQQLEWAIGAGNVDMADQLRHRLKSLE